MKRYKRNVVQKWQFFPVGCRCLIGRCGRMGRDRLLALFSHEKGCLCVAGLSMISLLEV